MQITYHQQYKDLGDRLVIAMGPNENFVPIKKNTNMDVPLAFNHIRLRHEFNDYEHTHKLFRFK